jgi:hypothetical protein
LQIQKLREYVPVDPVVRADKRQEAGWMSNALVELYDWVCACVDEWDVIQLKAAADETGRRLGAAEARRAAARANLQDFQAGN